MKRRETEMIEEGGRGRKRRIGRSIRMRGRRKMEKEKEKKGE